MWVDRKSLVLTFSIMKSDTGEEYKQNGNAECKDNRDNKYNCRTSINPLAETDIQAPVIAANYNARYSQQHTLNEQFDLVLNLLSTQYAWNQFIFQALDIEFEKQDALYKYLHQLNDEWRKRNDDFAKRMVLSQHFY
jgi:hypothetical protein